jgi:uncharacterized repeat protein (TIGR02543 family)
MKNCIKMKTKSGILGMLNIILASGIFLVGCNNGSVTTYTVTFNSNGGSAVDAISGISPDATITLPQNPTKGTDIFGGWFLDNGTFLNEFTASTVVTQDITVYAKWNSINPYIGHWVGITESDITLEILNDTDWELRDDYGAFNYIKGTYVYEGNNATITMTHMWDHWDSESEWIGWEEVPSKEKEDFQGVSLSITLNEDLLTLAEWGDFARQGQDE